MTHPARALLAFTLILTGTARADDSPEARALAFLVVEVPRWSREHRCFSCHNDGDGARALYSAVRLGRVVPAGATLDVDRWLGRPEAWDKDNGGDGPFSDKGLARIQFTSALALGVESGRIQDRSALDRAADRLARDQAADGSWILEGPDTVGSPVTYGRALATWSARESLRISNPSRHRAAIDRADAWLGRRPIETVMDASTVLLAGAFDAPGRRAKALGVLERGQSDGGGWGPFERSPTEVFDTSLALLALDRHRDRPGVARMIARGRADLVRSQALDGSWAETTRPTGQESYAQRISTTSWAAMALWTVKVP